MWYLICTLIFDLCGNIGVREGEHDSLMEEVKSENSSYGSMDDESMLAGLDFTFEDIRLFVDDWNAPNLSQQVYIFKIPIYIIIISIYLDLTIISST